MKIVVTGSQSFIGQRLITFARGAGVAVLGLDTLPAAGGDCCIDIRDGRLGQAIPAETDALVHLAAISRDRDCRDNPHRAFDVNVTGTLNVVRACRERGVKQLIFASTEWVYGNSLGAVQRESDTIAIESVAGEYALSKVAAERLLAMACPRDLPNITVLRFGIVYGPRAGNWSAVESLADKVARSVPIEVGSLRTARRFIHVDDIARGILAAMNCSGFQVFNLSGARLLSLADVIRASARVYGCEPVVTETDPAAVSIRNPDSTKATETLGWRATVELEAGLRTLPVLSSIASA